MIGADQGGAVSGRPAHPDRRNPMSDEIQFDGFDHLKTDPNLEIGEGIDVDFENGVIITIRRAGGRNVAYSQALTKRIPKKNRKLLPEEDRRMMAEVYAESIVIGWQGVTANGELVPFSKENVVKLFLAIPDLFQEIATQANNLDNFLIEASEETEKNLESLSDGH